MWLVVRAFRVVWRGDSAACCFRPPPSFLAATFSQVDRAADSLLAAAILMGGTIGLGSYPGAPSEPWVHARRSSTASCILRSPGGTAPTTRCCGRKPDTVVLQMANPDVTDETLQYLEGMSRLRELDLNDSQITDAGLPLLGRLPALQILRLRKTRITDQGFREHLAGKSTLLELDLRQTEVTSKTLRAWKAENKDQRKYLR